MTLLLPHHEAILKCPRNQGRTLSYLPNFDSYLVAVHFDTSQLALLNKFIGKILNRHSYIVKNSVVLDSDEFAAFTSQLASPEFDISFGSMQDATRFRDRLAGATRQ